MSLAIYIKDPPKNLHNSKKKDRYFAIFIISVGIASIFFAAWPFVTWQFSTLSKLSPKIENAPVPQGQVLSQQSALALQVQIAQDKDGFSYFTTDYKPEGKRPKQFYLSIQKLKIKNAKVVVDSLDFYKNLSHFPGTAIPGEIGNSFVTGHSVLPQFNDPKDYRAIFTKLPSLEIGDEIKVNLAGEIYTYVVQYSKVVDPKDLSVLAPILPGSKNLTLMTCVPPGSSSKRLVIISSLI